MLKLITNEKTVAAPEIAAWIPKTLAHQEMERTVAALRAERDARQAEMRTVARQKEASRDHEFWDAQIRRLDTDIKAIEAKLNPARAELAEHARDRGARVETALAGRRRAASDRIAEAQEIIRANLAELEDLYDAIARSGGSMSAPPAFFDMVGISLFVRRYRSQS